ncbi:hypothetical protein P3W85_24350 [Cupriavidus basilensis]|uniref:Uncharacterized protein n=1 Tax=Cupriavidus basilensis TaxID=68895 RepID=A0ABT6ATV5_9BURK|nr:hypothetical protein [Cupriavidus basilensis]MDF3836059.1 hypothetical protein [Cupriavidus basilensis]
MTQIDKQTRKLAAIAYGEASVADDPNEIGGIAYAVANRARAWGGKTVDQLLAADPNYTYAVSDGNVRYQKLMDASDAQIAKNKGMTAALQHAISALANTGTDPSNGAFWWDGLDFRTKAKHPKRKDGFYYGDEAHNIFNVDPVSKPVTIYWKVANKKTGKEVNSKVRGKYEYVWVSTAAHGQTIFWTHDSDYLEATGGKAYR